ncbi:hypothetical protein NHQ30_006844 [Ciborinia camelliae]|nr:hypothetical protein NHQ30_006844 [Ciborinia camelliae]
MISETWRKLNPPLPPKRDSFRRHSKQVKHRWEAITRQIVAMQAIYKRKSPVEESSQEDFGLSAIDQLKKDTDPQSEMPLSLATVVENSNETPTKLQRDTQKAVSRWFDSHPSPNAPDIYQPEWQERIASWQKCRDRTSYIPAPHSPRFSQWLSELDFSKFFVTYPVPSISLWNLTQALHELDEAVCKDSDAIVKWRAMAPFKYLLTAGKIEIQWRSSLRRFKTRILKHEISNEESIKRLCEISCSADKVEEVLAELKENFLHNLKDKNFTQKMLDEIECAVNWRFNTIDNSLKFSKEELKEMEETNEKQKLGEHAS